MRKVFYWFNIVGRVLEIIRGLRSGWLLGKRDLADARQRAAFEKANRGDACEWTLKEVRR